MTYFTCFLRSDIFRSKIIKCSFTLFNRIKYERRHLTIKYFNEVMDYIESHLVEGIPPGKIAKITGTSEYHFRKMFSYLSGMTLNSYINQRRFALANSDLLKSASVTDVAFKYAYQTVEGFSRAFKVWSGRSPSDIYEAQFQKSFSPFRFTSTIKGGNSMEVNIEKKPAFNLIGVTKRVPIQFEGENPTIVELAKSITPEQREHMHELGDLYPHHVLNASYEGDEGILREEGNLTHLIGFASTKENPYDDLEQVHVPEHTWAIFPNTGPFPETLQDTWARTHSEWMPSSDYEFVNAPSISFTKHGEPGEDVYSEIWLAVKKKD